ncbi:MAG: hypothetical protein ACTSUE_22830 [Promethearchaeota archaeon]
MPLKLQDNRAVRIHGYSKSEEEKKSPPSDDLFPTKEEWNEIWERAMNVLVEEKV